MSEISWSNWKNLSREQLNELRRMDGVRYSPMSIKERMIAFLYDTAKFYNLENRAVIGESPSTYACSYYRTEKSPGCAIGRHVDLDDCEEKQCSLAISAIVGSCKFFDSLIPNWMKEMDINFLRDIQILHDLRGHWQHDGIGPYGVYFLTEMLKTYKLDTFPINEFKK